MNLRGEKFYARDLLKFDSVPYFFLSLNHFAAFAVFGE